MRSSTPHRHWVLLLALLLPATGASALTLGRVQGAALIGRPLSLTIPVTLEHGADDACLDVEVFQGDSRMNPSRVISRIDGAAGGSAAVRVLSADLVEEPVVTLYVRVGCTQKITRRYVLLADYVPEGQGDPRPRLPGPLPGRAAEPASSVQAVPARPRREPAAAGLPLAPTPQLGAPRPASGAAARGAGPAASAAASAAGRPSAGPRRDPTVAAAGPRARLRLEPLDLDIDRSPVLRGSTELLTQPSADPQRRALASATWQALNARPEDVLRQSERLQALEGSITGLRQSMQRNNDAVQGMREQVEKARGERNLLALLLAALLLAGAAGGFWAWRRTREGGFGGRWWDGREAGDSELDDSLPVPSTPPPTAAPAAPVTAPVAMGRTPAAPPARTPSVAPRSSRASAMASAADAAWPHETGTAGQASGAPVGRRAPVAPQPGHAPAAQDPVLSGPDSRGGFSSDFQFSHAASVRMVKAEELIDIQQQAEFFLSIGQHEQAILVLENHVHNSVETSALAWLDLLAIYHSLDKRDDYERVRREFQQHFNAQVPEFEAYSTRAAGLEAYGKALSRIVRLWGTPRVLEVIEESIFRRPGIPGAEPFDLEAYRELVLLYNIARDIVGPSTRESARMGQGDWQDSFGGPRTAFPETGLQQLSAHLDEPLPELAAVPLPPPSVAPAPDPRWGSPEHGIDIDLDALPPPDDRISEGNLIDFDFDESMQPIPPPRRH